jgi:hypothetical protein
MHAAVLRTLLTRRPFKPFRITVSTNEKFDVRHPEAAYLARRFLAVVRPPADAGASRATDMLWIDYKHIVHCQPVEATRSSE